LVFTGKKGQTDNLMIVINVDKKKKMHETCV